MVSRLSLRENQLRIVLETISSDAKPAETAAVVEMDLLGLRPAAEVAVDGQHVGLAELVGLLVTEFLILLEMECILNPLSLPKGEGLGEGFRTHS